MPADAPVGLLTHYSCRIANTGGAHGIGSIGQERTGGPNGNSDHVYRVIQVVGTSKRNLSDAIEFGMRAAAIRCAILRRFEVERISGHIDRGKVAHYQAKMTICFTMEEPG